MQHGPFQLQEFIPCHWTEAAARTFLRLQPPEGQNTLGYCCRMSGLETAKSPHRSIHTRATVPPPVPPPHETLATPAACETAPPLRDSSLPSPRSTHSPAPPHLFPAAAAASAPKRQSSKADIQPIQLLCLRSHAPPIPPAFYAVSPVSCRGAARCALCAKAGIWQSSAT
jgi:hypothetical protein